MGDENLGDLSPEDEAKFGKFLEKHLEAERKKAEKSKPPKDFGEGADRIAAAVLDALDKRVKERAEGGNDDPPHGSGAPAKKGGILGFLGGESG